MKKIGSHVGLVLSFVIFVTFIFFVFTVLNPAVKRERGKEIILDAVKENLMDKIRSNLTVTSLKFQKETVGCFEIINFSNLEEESLLIKNELEEIVGFKINEGRIQIKDADNTFFKVYLSPEFEVKTGEEGCEFITDEEYSIGSIRTTEYVFEEKINSLLSKYEKNYAGLKEDLGISEDTEFGISFTNSSDVEVQKGFEPVSGNIYIDEIPIQYYNSFAEVKPGSIKIRIW